jgi:hypothetical protein
VDDKSMCVQRKTFLRLDLDLTIENVEFFSVFLVTVASIRKVLIHDS